MDTGDYQQALTACCPSLILPMTASSVLPMIGV
jgi:hypothetical protein